MYTTTDLGKLIDELSYASYAHNRRLAPDVLPERWAIIFQNAAELEARFQQEETMKGLSRFMEWRGGCEREDYDA